MSTKKKTTLISDIISGASSMEVRQLKGKEEEETGKGPEGEAPVVQEEKPVKRKGDKRAPGASLFGELQLVKDKDSNVDRTAAVTIDKTINNRLMMLSKLLGVKKYVLTEAILMDYLERNKAEIKSLFNKNGL